MAHYKLLFSIIVLCFFIDQLNCQAVVNINGSQITGKILLFDNKEVSQYLGIPYAHSPVRALRFKKPVPAHSLPKVYLAYDSPSACWQRSEYPFPWYDGTTVKKENCLFLNIWTPTGANPDNLKAVIYWIHGGGYRYGSIAQSVYQGTPLAALGDVVVVTVNYRLGPFGFLDSGTQDAPGNVGLWDILQGLRWVNDNIHYFGGDKSKITIAGQGAGSTVVGLLSVSPLAKDLYQRQIMESGSPVNLEDNDRTRNQRLSQLVAERINCANETFTLLDNPKAVVKCLKGVSAEGLSAAHAGINPHFTSTFTPSYGDELLPSNPRVSILNGQANCKDVLIGSTRDEGSYILSTENPNVFGFFGVRKPQISKKNGKILIQRYFSNFTDPGAVADHYLPSDLPKNSSVRQQVYDSMGDKSFTCPTMYYADKCADSGGNVYVYLWDHRPTVTPWAPWMGVTHFSDVQFVFGTPIINPDIYDPEELQLSSEIIEMWASFAKTGKPSTSWPLYSRDNPQLKHLGPEPNTEEYSTNPHKDNCDFFKPYFGF